MWPFHSTSHSSNNFILAYSGATNKSQFPNKLIIIGQNFRWMCHFLFYLICVEIDYKVIITCIHGRWRMFLWCHNRLDFSVCHWTLFCNVHNCLNWRRRQMSAKLFAESEKKKMDENQINIHFLNFFFWTRSASQFQKFQKKILNIKVIQLLNSVKLIDCNNKFLVCRWKFEAVGLLASHRRHTDEQFSILSISKMMNILRIH